MRRDTPYKGLVPYDEEDAEFFFGRDSQRDIIIANLMASRLTLVYGPSGVGKSSVLRAGVEHRLKKISEQDIENRGAPEFAFVVFNSWRDSPVEAIQTLLERNISRFFAPHNPLEKSTRVFCDTLANWTGVIGDVYIVLDQFEEYFLYHAHERGENSFAMQFGKAVNRADLRVNFLISIREDSLAKLDFFKGRIPGLFDNYLRIDHLDRDAARQAITAPIEKYNGLYRQHDPPITIEPALTEAVLDQVKAGHLNLADVGAGGIESKKSSNLIETPYLQLVMSRLWDEELGSGSTELRLATLERLGRAENIVRTHLDETMSSLSLDEQKIAAEAFDYLVTPSGTKIAYYARDLAKHLAKHTEITSAELEPVLERLATGRNLILRKVAVTTDPDAPPRYEIFHDVLAKAVLDWSSRFKIRRKIFKDIMDRAQEKASRLRLGLTSIILLALAVLVLGVLLYTKTRQADELKNRIRALEIASKAKGKLEVDVELAALLARESMKLARTPQAESILRQSLANNPSLLIIRVGDAPVQSAVFSDDGSLALLTSSNGAVVWDMRSRKKLSQFTRPEPLQTSALSPLQTSALSHGGELAVIGTTEGEVCIWKTSSGQAVKCFPGHVRQDAYRSYVTHVAFSRDDQYIVTAGDDGYARVWDTTGMPAGEPLPHKWKVNWAEFSSSSEFVVTASQDGTAGVWNWRTRALKTLPHAAEVLVAKFSLNGKLVATICTDGTAKIWDAGNAKEIFNIRRLYPVVDASFSTDSTRIVIASAATAEVLTVQGKNPVYATEYRAGPIKSAVFSSDGNYVLSAYHDGLAVISSARTGVRECHMGSHSYYSFTTAVYNPDGKSIMAAGTEVTGSYRGGVVRLWRSCGPTPDTAWEYSAPVASLLQAYDERIARDLTQIEKNIHSVP